jgi:predicted anti-sigma-YlaC factor YlaD
MKEDLVTRLLGTTDEDAGCETAFAFLAEYVDGELAGQPTAAGLAAVAAHLHNCPACADDYGGLLALMREQQRS